MLHIKAIHWYELPSFSCEDCGHVAWARKPLIGGREFVCAVCYPVRLWSPISDADFKAAHTKTPPKPKKPVQVYEEDEAA